MEPNHLTMSQTNWNKPGLFGKLVLWNRPRGVRSQKTHKLMYDLLSVWTKEIKAIIFFPLHHIASNRIVLNQNKIESHWIIIGVNRIASLAASYVSSMYRIIGYASRCVSHQLWRCTSLICRRGHPVHISDATNHLDKTRPDSRRNRLRCGPWLNICF